MGYRVIPETWIPEGAWFPPDYPTGIYRPSFTVTYTITCPSCGATLAHDYNFCPYCGFPFGAEPRTERENKQIKLLEELLKKLKEIEIVRVEVKSNE